MKTLMQTTQIAKVTSLEHRYILRMIRSHSLKVSNSKALFEPAHYLSENNQLQPCYNVSSEGVMYLINHLSEAPSKLLRRHYTKIRTVESPAPKARNPQTEINKYLRQNNDQLKNEISYLKGIVSAYEHILRVNGLLNDTQKEAF